MSFLRKVTPFEKLTLNSKNWTQLAVQLTDTRLIPQIIEMLKNEVIGLHLRVENNSIIYDKNDNILVRSPKELSIMSLEKGVQYCYKNKPSESTRLGEILYYGDKLILNVCHICADGRFLTKQIDNIINTSKYNFKGNKKKILTPFEVCFRDQLNNMEVSDENIHFDPKISRILINNYGINHDEYYHYDSITFPARLLKVYNKETKKISGFNEELLTSFILTSLAFSNKIKKYDTNWFKSFGTSICIDLKSKIERNSDTVCNAYGQINAIASVNESMTIRQVNKLLKKDIVKKKAGDEAFLINNVAKNNSIKMNNEINLPGRRIDMSNVVPIYIKEPVLDVWIGHGQKNNFKGSFYSYSFSVVNDAIAKNDLSIVFRHDNKEMNSNDVHKFGKTMKHFLTNIPLGASLGDAFNELNEFMKSDS